MPEVSAGTHRGNVCEALSTDEWMDFNQVAKATTLSLDGASSVLSDVHGENYVKRREISGEKPHDAQYEYQLHENVRVE